MTTKEQNALVGGDNMTNSASGGGGGCTNSASGGGDNIPSSFRDRSSGTLRGLSHK